MYTFFISTVVADSEHWTFFIQNAWTVIIQKKKLYLAMCSDRDVRYASLQRKTLRDLIQQGSVWSTLVAHQISTKYSTSVQ
jgi:hypothetical protein